MYRKIILSLIFATIWYTNQVVAHEMTPTYPELRPSFMDGLYTSKMQVFNKRDDVEYYEIDVMDENFFTIPFAAKHKILNVGYLSHVEFDIYVRQVDVHRAYYICTTSRLKKDVGKDTMVASKICSKFVQH